MVRFVWPTPASRERMLDSLAGQLLMEPAETRRILRAPYFGTAWAEFESKSALLGKERLLVRDPQDHIRQAQAIVDFETRRRRINHTAAGHSDTIFAEGSTEV